MLLTFWSPAPAVLLQLDRAEMMMSSSNQLANSMVHGILKQVHRKPKSSCERRMQKRREKLRYKWLAM